MAARLPTVILLNEFNRSLFYIRNVRNLFRLGNGNLFRLGNGNLFRLGNGNLFRLGNGNLFRLGNGNLFRLGNGNLFRLGNGNLFRLGNGNLFRLGNGNLFRLGNGNLFRLGNGNLFRLGNGNLFRLGNGNLFRLGNGNLFRLGNGNLFRLGNLRNLFGLGNLFPVISILQTAITTFEQPPAVFEEYDLDGLRIICYGLRIICYGGVNRSEIDFVSTIVRLCLDLVEAESRKAIIPGFTIKVKRRDRRKREPLHDVGKSVSGREIFLLKYEDTFVLMAGFIGMFVGKLSGSAFLGGPIFRAIRRFYMHNDFIPRTLGIPVRSTPHTGKC